MKRKLIYVCIFLLCVILQGFTGSCSDKATIVTIRNATGQAIHLYVKVGCDETYWPSDYWRMYKLLPFENVRVGEVFQSDLEAFRYGIKIWVVKDSSACKSSIEEIVNKRLYNYIRGYSYSELESCDYIIQIRDEDLRE